MKIGLIGRCDNTGLGNMSWEYFRQLKIDKVLLIKCNNANFPERFSHYEFYDRERPSIKKMKQFISDLDLLLTIETPYNWNVYQLARQMKVKTVLIPMYEFLDTRRELDYVDLFMADSLIAYDKCPKSKRVFIPCPVNRDVLPFKLRTKAKIFLHNAGHGGMIGRNGTSELIKAMDYVESDVKLIINSQYPLDKVNNSKIIINIGNLKNYWDLWDYGDVFILPCRFGGNFMPFNEAMSVGMPVMTTDMYPHNTYLPEELLIKPIETGPIILGNIIIDMSFHSPGGIASAMDEIASQDITRFSKEADKHAEKISWNALRPIILKTFKELCKGKIKRT